LIKTLGITYEELLQDQFFQKLKIHSSTSESENINKLLGRGLNKKGQSYNNCKFDALECSGVTLSTISGTEVYRNNEVSKRGVSNINKPDFQSK
jgi:hypothetical protein|tara:strand:- start:975 stop:1256 length:282 start_codon:yes stop_codon:yes gene_type:complete